MNQQEILEYNKRCALFLDRDDLLTKWEKRELNLNLYKDKIPLNNINILHPEPNEKFHSDWNWIMNVKTKIDGLYHKGFPIVTNIGSSGMYIGINTSNVSGNRYEGDKEIANTLNINYHVVLDKNKINLKEAVVEAINQFLIWYEQNKQL